MNNGNSGFTKIYNASNQFSTLNVGDLNASNVDATIINGEQFITVTGYAPTQFATTAATGYVALLTSPNQSAPTATTLATDARLLQIPAGAVIRRVVATNNGTLITNTGVSTYTVAGFTTTGAAGTGVIQPAVAAGATFLTATTLALLNTANGGALAEVISVNAANVVGGVGVAFTRTTAPSLVGVLVNVGNNTAGSLKVSITYSVFSA